MRHAALPVRKVLLVEDHADTAMLVARVLRQLGQAVQVADCCADALAAAAATEFDVAVCDLGLPDGDGRDLLAGLLLLRPHLRAVALTGYAHRVPHFDADGHVPVHGFEATLLKPMSLDALQAVLRLVGVDDNGLPARPRSVANNLN